MYRLTRVELALVTVLLAALTLPEAQQAAAVHHQHGDVKGGGGGAEGGGGGAVEEAGRGGGTVPHARVFFPPDMHCFTDPEKVYLQVAISRELSLEISSLPCMPSCPSSIGGLGLPCDDAGGFKCASPVVVIGDVKVDLGWAGIVEAEEDGASWHVALPGKFCRLQSSEILNYDARGTSANPKP